MKIIRNIILYFYPNARYSFMKPNKLTLIDSLHMELRERFKEFNYYLNNISTNLKFIDNLRLSDLGLYQIGNLISDDPLILFNIDEIAWPRNAEEIENISVSVKQEGYSEAKIEAVAFNSELFNEVLPPFRLYELAFTKKYKKGETVKNVYKLKVLKKIPKNYFSEARERIEDILEMLSETLTKENDAEIMKLLLVDFSLSCIDWLHFPKEDRDKIFEMLQNFLLTTRSLNIIPVSLSSYNGSPFLASILIMMEKNGQKNLLQNFDLISDKLYFAGKLEIGDRTPVFEYSNQVFDNPYTKEKCFLFYVRLDKDVIQRIEIPGFALNHIETIHAMLLNEYKLSIN